MEALDSPNLPAVAVPVHPKTWESIDFLRAAGILGVLFYHCIFPAFHTQPLTLREFISGPWTAEHWLFPLTFSSVRVPLFFVISGFCIHWSFLRSKNWSLGSFLWRRFWRLYPAYLVALVVFILLKTGWPVKWTKHFWNILDHFLLVHNFNPRFFKTYNGSFWTMAVEVQLYLLYPVLLVLRRQWGMVRTLWLLFILANVLRLAALPWVFDEDGKLQLVLTDATLFHWFDWAVGACMAERMFAGERAFSRWPLWLVAGLWLLADLSPWTALWKFSLASIMAAIVMERLLFWESAGGRLSRWPAVAWLQGIGLISYSIYLWHMPLLGLAAKWLAPLLRDPWQIYAALTFGVAPLLVVASWLSYRYLEKGGMQLGAWLARKLDSRAKKRVLSQSPLVQNPSSG